MNEKGICAHIAETHLHHICETDVSDRLWSLFAEDRRCREAQRPSRTKRSWLVHGEKKSDGAPQLRAGHFSAVITLCACSPRGPVAATEGSHAMMDVVFSEAPGQMANTLMKI